MGDTIGEKFVGVLGVVEFNLKGDNIGDTIGLLLEGVILGLRELGLKETRMGLAVAPSLFDASLERRELLRIGEEKGDSKSETLFDRIRE